MLGKANAIRLPWPQATSSSKLSVPLHSSKLSTLRMARLENPVSKWSWCNQLLCKWRKVINIDAWNKHELFLLVHGAWSLSNNTQWRSHRSTSRSREKSWEKVTPVAKNKKNSDDRLTRHNSLAPCFLGRMSNLIKNANACFADHRVDEFFNHDNCYENLIHQEESARKRAWSSGTETGMPKKGVDAQC